MTSELTPRRDSAVAVREPWDPAFRRHMADTCRVPGLTHSHRRVTPWRVLTRHTTPTSVRNVPPRLKWGIETPLHSQVRQPRVEGKGPVGWVAWCELSRIPPPPPRLQLPPRPLVARWQEYIFFADLQGGVFHAYSCR